MKYILFSTLILTASAQASHYWDNGGGDSEWGTAINWDEDIVPADDSDLNGVLQQNQIVFVSSAVSTTSAARILVRTGASLSIRANMLNVNYIWIGKNSSSARGGGAMAHSAGTVTPSAYVRLGNSTGFNATTKATYTLSGTASLSSSDLAIYEGGLFSVVGSDCSLTLNDGFSVSTSGALHFELGTDGVSAIDVADLFSVDNVESVLSIDASGFTGESAVIELVKYSSISGEFASGNTSISGLNSALSASIEYDADSMNLVIEGQDLGPVMALADLTDAPALYDLSGNSTTWSAISTAATSEIQGIYYDGLDYEGNATRVFAWVGLPANASASAPVPAVVLVHGGGGTAIAAWVQEWTDRGYAALAMDNEGDAFDVSGNEIDSPYPGPSRTGIYKDSDLVGGTFKVLEDQWEYHATATVILANSLLRAAPEVVTEQVGAMGVSWGGVLTSTAIGIDTRFAFAIPVYGCGHLFDLDNQYGAALGDNEYYQTVWDPILRMHRATMPVLWYSWPQEGNFSLDSQAATYGAGNGNHMVALVPGMNHSHGSAYRRPESYDFADSVVNNGSAWAKQESININGSAVEVVFTSTKALHTPTIVYTLETGYTGDLIWTEIAAASLVESPVGTWTVQGTLPTGATGWFINVKGASSVGGYRDSDNTLSSDYQEVITLTLEPSDQFEMSHSTLADQSTGQVDFSFTAPTNVEISAITIINESHLGAFTSLLEAPILLSAPAPTTTSLDLEFDNAVAGLVQNETATGTLVITWEVLDGSTNQVELPISATAVAPATVVYNTSVNWSTQTVSAIDDVIVNGGAWVILDEDAAVGSLTVNDQVSPASGIFQIKSSAMSLSVAGEINLGVDTGRAVFAQSNGTVIADGLTVNASSSGSACYYRLINGELSLYSALAVNTGGSLLITGGALDHRQSDVSLDGSLTLSSGSMTTQGLLVSGAGEFNVSGGSFTVSDHSTVKLNMSLFEISGGTVDFGSKWLYLGDGGVSELRVVGDSAVINMGVLHQKTTTASEGTFNFVFNATGISTINVSSFMHLQAATITVDGSAYTGGAGSFILMDSTNFVTTASESNISVTGFAENGLTATITQDQSAGAEYVILDLATAP